MFCERVRKEAFCWEKRHKDALRGHFTNRQEQNEIFLPEIPDDFEEWEPKKHKRMKNV